ncbi:MAG: hypothetical protein HN522_03345 [Flavobacteriales bacterium]|jgi:hypothetical protein|nr:hypothetical protein [Flavobacteriales bacterium]MBT7624060.1 hypothetical protein [Flavobacteriaceae bacterium]
MLNFLLFMFGFVFGCIVASIFSFLFFINRKIELQRDQIENQEEYVEVVNKYKKIERELLEYKNEFKNKYVDDGYDAY